MDRIFLQILNMSITASIVIVFVFVVRLFLRKVPKVFSYMLWFVVLFRLLCPFSFESAYSLLPTKENPISQDIMYQSTPSMDTGVAIIDYAVNEIFPVATEEASVNPIQIWIFIGSFLWIVGVGVLLSYSLITFFRLKRCLKTAIRYKDNIFLSDRIETAFVMGMFRPHIYLPFHLKESEREYIILHEQTHIKRLDPIIKVISFFVLCIHWFNPFVWIAFFTSAKDMEMSCDEAVIKKIGNHKKKEYSTSLLNLATGRNIVGGTPIAFGEGDTKSRIKNVLNYKKPTFWVILFTLFVIGFVGIGLLANPVQKSIELPNVKEVERIQVEQVQEGNSLGQLRISDKTEMEALLNALANGKTTRRQSVNDFPNVKNYFKIEIFVDDSQTFYLYKINDTYYVEEPYVGIYKAESELHGIVEEIYASNEQMKNEASSTSDQKENQMETVAKDSNKDYSGSISKEDKKELERLLKDYYENEFLYKLIEFQIVDNNLPRYKNYKEYEVGNIIIFRVRTEHEIKGIYRYIVFGRDNRNDDWKRINEGY